MGLPFGEEPTPSVVADSPGPFHPKPTSAANIRQEAANCPSREKAVHCFSPFSTKRPASSTGGRLPRATDVRHARSDSRAAYPQRETELERALRGRNGPVDGASASAW